MKDFKVLLVEEDASSLSEMGLALEEKGYQVAEAADSVTALKILTKGHFDLVVIDLKENSLKNMKCLQEIKALNPHTLAIVLIENYKLALARNARQLGADGYIFKPSDGAEMRKRLLKSVKKLELKRGKRPPQPNLDLSNEQVLNLLKVTAHDIREPLITITGMLKLLSKGLYGQMDETVSSKLNELMMKVVNLIGITEEGLGRTFAVNDSLEMEIEALDLKQDIIDPVLTELSLEIREKNIKIENSLDVIYDSRVPVRGNRFWLKAVIRNLLKNAIKYSDRDCSITLGFEDRVSCYQLNVYNSGKIIPEDSRCRLFTKFGRMTNDGKGYSNGLGLGLYLIKKVIDKHGGKIWYEGKDQGSNFIFTLPRINAQFNQFPKCLSQ